MFHVGPELLKVKAMLPHGQFGRWCETEARLDTKTAQRCMGAAKVFGDKYDTVSGLTVNTIYELSKRSTPAWVRDDILARLDRGEGLTSQTVVDLVATARKNVAEARASSSSEHAEGRGQVRADYSARGRRICAKEAAQRAAEIVFQLPTDLQREFARQLPGADAHEFLKRVRQGQGCAVDVWSDPMAIEP